jgi:hypothetical protein
MDWESGDGEDDLVGSLGGPLVEESVCVAKGARDGMFGNDAAAEFVRNENHMAGFCNGSDSMDLSMGSILDVFIAAEVLIAEIAQPDRQAIDEHDVGFVRRALDCICQRQWFLDGSPGSGSLGAVMLDAGDHFLIVSLVTSLVTGFINKWGASGGDIGDPFSGHC